MHKYIISRRLSLKVLLLQEEKMKKEILVKTHYIHNDDILKGYIILHVNLRPPGINHLDYVRIKCKETNKTIFCRIFGPGNKGKYNQGKFASIDKEKYIFLDAYYRDRLKIKNNEVDKREFNFIISKGNQIYLGLRAAFTHPEMGIKVSTILGFISIVLAIISIMMAIIS